jgi:hypothetical protein
MISITYNDFPGSNRLRVVAGDSAWCAIAQQYFT